MVFMACLASFDRIWIGGAWKRTTERSFAAKVRETKNCSPGVSLLSDGAKVDARFCRGSKNEELAFEAWLANFRHDIFIPP
jgi:hypothetical protein